MKVLSYAPEKVAKIVNLDVENAEAVEAFVGKKPIVLDLAHGLKLFYSDNYKRAWNKKVFVSQYNDGVVESRCMSIHSPYFIAQTDGNNYCNKIGRAHV